MEKSLKAVVALATLVSGVLFAAVLCYSLAPNNSPVASPETALPAGNATTVPGATDPPAPTTDEPPPSEKQPSPGGGLSRNGLKIELAKTNYNAWPLIKAQNQFNDPPTEGREMLMLTLRVTNLSGNADEPVMLWDSDFKLIGNRNRMVAPFQASCGVVPDELHGVVPLNGTLDGNICFQVSPNEADFQLIYQPFNLPATTLPVPDRSAAGLHPVPVPPPLTEGDRLTRDGLRLAVVATNFDAWPLVQAQNPNNEPPPDGRAMLLITIRAKNQAGTGDGYPAIRESEFKLVNSRGDVFTTFNPGCGVIPDELDSVVARGEAVDGNICFEIPAQPDSYELLHEVYGSPPVLIPLPATAGSETPRK